MDSRTTAFNVHAYLSEQSGFIIEYLKMVAKKYHYIGDIFDTPEKRLFFPESSSSNQSLDIIDNIFSKQELLDDFEKKLRVWRPLFTENNINMSRQLVRDFYFQPIKQQPEWESFFASQKELVKKRFQPDSVLNRKMQSIEDQLSGAFTFRIISAFMQHNPGVMVEKANLLAKILNVATPTNTLIVEFEDSLKKDILNKFSFLIASGENIKEFSLAIEHFYNKFLFNGIHLAPTILWNTIMDDLLEKSKKKENDILAIKKTLANTIFDKLINGDHDSSTHTPALLRKISSHLKSSTRKKHPHLFPDPLEAKSISDTSLTNKRHNYKTKSALYSATQSNITYTKPHRKMSAPPIVEKSSIEVTPRSDMSSSTITPRSESSLGGSDLTPRIDNEITGVSVIRPNRAGRMRKRTSLVSIFSPRSVSEDDKNQQVTEKELATPREDSFKKK